MSNERKQQPEKISADCPHCGFSQLESAYAKSTFCRQCREHFSIEKLLAKEVGSLKAPSFFDKIGKAFSRETNREVNCFSCRAPQTVSAAAESTSCPKCGSYIDLRDFKITGPFGRGIQTQGEVTITSKGDVTSQRILCGSAWIEGKMRSQMVCTGTVHVKIQGKLLGSVHAHNIVVEKKSELELTKPFRVEGIEINGKLNGEIYCDGRVTINKHGVLNGTVHARAIVVEKGGIFFGELHIGQEPSPETAAAPATEAGAPELIPAPFAPEEPTAPVKVRGLTSTDPARRRPLTLQSAPSEEKRAPGGGRLKGGPGGR